MFLDDELKQIWETPTELADRANRIYKACMARIDQTSPCNFINSVKRVDSSFRLFAKRTNEINENWLKDRLCEAIKESKVADDIFRMLNWKL